MAIDLVARLSLDDQMSGPLSSLNSKLMGMVGFAAVTGGATAAVKKFADFDTAMRKAATIAGASDAEFNQMAETAKELGASTSLSASQVAEAMTEMAAKGYNANQVMDSMPGIISAAEASGEDLAMTADVVSSALNIWGMEASAATDVADVLAMTANKTAAGVGDMQYALKYAGAPAKNLGISLEEVSAAAGLLANAGTEGSQAGTSLRQGLLSLTGPTKTAQKTMDALGFTAIKSNGKVKSLTGIIKSMKEATNEMTDAQKAATVKQLVGTEASSAFLTLMDAGPGKIKKLTEELENSSGASAEAAAKMKAGIGGALQQASGNLETFALRVGDALAPAVTEFANFIAAADTKEIGNSLKDIGETVLGVSKTIIENWRTIQNTVMLATYAFIGVKAAVLAVNTAIAATNVVIKAVNLSVKIFKALKTAFLVARGAALMLNAALLANPIVLVTLAVGALIAGVILLYKNWDKVTSSIRTAWSQFKEGRGIFIKLLGPIGQLIKTAITIRKEWSSTRSIWGNIWHGIKVSATSTINEVIDGVNKMINVINKLPGVNIPIVAKVQYDYSSAGSVDNKVAKVTNSGAAATSNTLSGPHALGNHGGWNEIRTDGTLRSLHAGERVLTAVENDGYKQMMQSGLPTAIAKMASLGTPRATNNVTQNEATTTVNNYSTQLPSLDFAPIVAAIKSIVLPSTSNSVQNATTTNNSTASTTVNNVDKSVTSTSQTSSFDVSALTLAFKSLMPTTLDNMHGASTAETKPFDFTSLPFDDVISAINKVAKRTIDVIVPKDERTGRALESISEILGLTLSAKDSGALTTSVNNSTFSESVSNISTTNSTATTKVETAKTISPTFNFASGSFAVREEADVDKIIGAMHDKLASLA